MKYIQLLILFIISYTQLTHAQSKFAFTYTQTLCKHSKCHENMIRPYFTIHGWWPKNQDCSKAFNINILDPIRDELDEKWPQARINFPLWQREWTKHGSCSGYDQLKYFQKSFILYDKYNINEKIRKIIDENGSTKFQTKNFVDKMHKHIGKRVSLQCPEKHRSNIEDIRICLDKDNKIIDCSPNIGNCNDNIIIESFEYKIDTRPYNVLAILMALFFTVLFGIVVGVIIIIVCIRKYRKSRAYPIQL
jgi:hypothetical protein